MRHVIWFSINEDIYRSINPSVLSFVHFLIHHFVLFFVFLSIHHFVRSAHSSAMLSVRPSFNSSARPSLNIMNVSKCVNKWEPESQFVAWSVCVCSLGWMWWWGKALWQRAPVAIEDRFCCWDVVPHSHLLPRKRMDNHSMCHEFQPPALIRWWQKQTEISPQKDQVRHTGIRNDHQNADHVSESYI